MANTSISNLAAGAAVSATDLVPNVQTAGVGPVKTTAAQLKTFMSASPTLVTPNIGVATGTSLDVSGVFESGANGGTGGQLKMFGSTSGDVTIKPAAAAGTATSFTLPATNGTNKYALTTNGSGVTSWGQIDLTAAVTGALPVANGGTGASSAGITAFNNITGYTASGATGTTSTNLVFSASPTFTGTVVAPIINGGGSSSLSLQANSSTAIYIDTSLNATFGGVSGGYKLSVIKNGTVGSAASTSGIIVRSDDTATYSTALCLGADGTGNVAYIQALNYNSYTTRPLAIMPQGGEVLCGGTTDNGAYNLQCNGTAVWGAGAYVNGSDARIKEQVADIGNCLALVATLRPVTFRYKDTFSSDADIQPGFIAQELQTALDGQVYLAGIVKTGPEYLSVAYQSLIPILTKALQELKADFDAYKAAHP
jgi:hypothetical protein